MYKDSIEEFISNIPKAELHIHIEGALEPELLFKLAKRNKIPLRHKSIDEIKSAYNFHNLQSFLDIYFEGALVLQTEQDFYDLTWSYIEKLRKQNVIHAEIFFDPQVHTTRGVSFEAVVKGINKALVDGKIQYDISSNLIMCFLRHLSAEYAMKTLEESLLFKDMITGVGLDSTEIGNPPSKFVDVFSKARSLGYLTVAHAGEEGPPEYIWEAINSLEVSRVDHGVRCIEDTSLVEELVRRDIPLTVCPLSNVRLGVFKSMKSHNIKQLIDYGLNITVNSDDPAYFGGYINENLLAIQKAFHLTKKDIYYLARNSFKASFLEENKKEMFIRYLNDFSEQNLVFQ